MSHDCIDFYIRAAFTIYKWYNEIFQIFDFMAKQ